MTYRRHPNNATYTRSPIRIGRLFFLYVMFADQELGFLRDYALEHGLDAPKRLGDAVRLVAHLGGYRDRKHDPDPGNQIMWHGQTRLTSAGLGHAIGFRAGQRHALRVEN